MPAIDKYLDIMMGKGASDLHLNEGFPAMLRVHGEILAINNHKLDRRTIVPIMKEICEPQRWEKYEKTGDIDFAHAYADKARFRTNYLRSKDGYGAVLRLIPSKILTLKELNLPPAVEKLTRIKSGLVLVTGPTGSGKSTTLAAVIDAINTTQSRHILTVEEPIEFVHKCKKSFIVQREVGIDVHSFSDALRASLRQDLDIILVGEMRTAEIIALAITAAEMGALVYATLHTNSAAKTIDRIIDSFQSEQQKRIRVMLGNSLRAICAQLLVRTKDGKGRCAVNEILLDAPGMGNAIREGKLSTIETIIQSGKKEGMQFMDDVLWDYVQKGIIAPMDAYLKANTKSRFAPLVEGQA